MRRNYTTLQLGGPLYWSMLAVLSVPLLAGLLAAHRMDTAGHWITGMTNQIVWGVPHVCAIFLIVSASGALNVASMASVFNSTRYAPLARLSCLLAIAFLVGGLLVLVLDLGRPDRLIVAMTTYNFRSVFAWNIFLYTGFVIVAWVYLWTLFEPRKGTYARRVGLFALLWRLVLTTGTGAIFGFLVARDAYDAAVMAPLFVAMSLALGTASFLLIAAGIHRLTGTTMDADCIAGLRKMNGIFVVVLLYFVVVQHVANIYVAQHHDIERFILLEGGTITALFWIGQVLIGAIVPMVLFFGARFTALRWTLTGTGAVAVGGLCQLYVIVIGGQAFPLDLFPGMRETSSFFDGVVTHYSPSMPELMLGAGGFALALLIVAVATRVLPFLPQWPDSGKATPE